MVKNGYINLAIKDEKIYLAIKQKTLDYMRKGIEATNCIVVEDILRRDLIKDGYLED